MSSTIVVPDPQLIGAYPQRIVEQLSTVASAAKSDIESIQSVDATQSSAISSLQAGSVVSTIGNVSASSGDLIVCDTTSGGLTVTLPTAVGRSRVRIIVIKKTSDGNTVTVAASVGQTVSLQSSISFAAPGTAVEVISDNSNWWVI